MTLKRVTFSISQLMSLCHRVVHVSSSRFFLILDKETQHFPNKPHKKMYSEFHVMSYMYKRCEMLLVFDLEKETYSKIVTT